MPDITGWINQTQKRSLFVKSGILVFGSVLILIGSEIRSESLYLGSAMWVSGVIIDWSIVYLVYTQMVEIRNDIEATRGDVRDTQEEILKTQQRAENAAQRIEGIATDMYDRQGSTDRWGNLKTTRENLSDDISHDESDPYSH